MTDEIEKLELRVLDLEVFDDLVTALGAWAEKIRNMPERTPEEAALFEIVVAMPFARDTPVAWTDALRALCRENCALFGDPPCYRLPEITSECEIVPPPCADCLAGRILD